MDHKTWHKNEDDLLLCIIKLTYAPGLKEIFIKWYKMKRVCL